MGYHRADGMALGPCATQARGKHASENPILTRNGVMSGRQGRTEETACGPRRLEPQEPGDL
jgi:hypothetical protein